MKTNQDLIKGKVKFLTPVPYYSTPELRSRGLVIVDLEQLQDAQIAHDKALSLYQNHIREEVEGIIKENYGKTDDGTILNEIMEELNIRI